MKMTVEGDKVKEVRRWQQNGEQALEVSTLRDFWTLGVSQGQPLLSRGAGTAFPSLSRSSPSPSEPLGGPCSIYNLGG